MKCVISHCPEPGDPLCLVHDDLWRTSPEHGREADILCESPHPLQRARAEAAIADFAHRLEAEERNAGPVDSAPMSSLKRALVRHWLKKGGGP